MVRRSYLLIGAGVLLLAVAVFLFQASFGAVASDWAYETTGVRRLQGQGYDGTGVTVAVVDTGLDRNHPSLKGIKLAGWRDFVNDRGDPYDDAGHGSHVAGILAGRGASFGAKLQGYTIRGAAPGVSLVAIKAISADGSGSSSDVAAGISYATQQRADVICLSLGSQTRPLSLVGDEITDAVNEAIGRGILVVAAAGNTGKDPSRSDVESPASIDRVIAVGAVDDDKRIADFSASGNEDKNYGYNGPTGRIPATAARADPNKKPEIVAPGVGIVSAWKGGAYVRADGTSQAAPFVCGALALVLQAKPELRGDNSAALIDRVKNALKNSAERVADEQTPHDPEAGYGLLRADELLRRV